MDVDKIGPLLIVLMMSFGASSLADAKDLRQRHENLQSFKRAEKIWGKPAGYFIQKGVFDKSSQTQVLPDNRKKIVASVNRAVKELLPVSDSVDTTIRINKLSNSHQQGLLSRFAEKSFFKDMSTVQKVLLEQISIPVSSGSPQEQYLNKATEGLVDIFTRTNTQILSGLTFDWSDFQQVQALALAEVTRLKMHGKKATLSFMSPIDLLRSKDVQRYASLSTGQRSGGVVVYPFVVNGRPVIKRKRKTSAEKLLGDGVVEIVAGEPVGIPVAYNSPGFRSGFYQGAQFLNMYRGVSPKKNYFIHSVAAHTTNKKVICSGTLVSEKHVLTAAHCACEPTIQQITIGGTVSGPSAIETRFLKKSKTSFFAKYKYGKDFCSFRKDGKWDPEAWKYGDLALWEIDDKFKPVSGARDQIAPLATINQVKRSKFVTVIGFGRTTSTEAGGEKQKGTINVASPQCSDSEVLDKGAKASSLFGCVTDIELVAASPLRGVDSCFGDSGGGALVKLSDGNYYLAGVTSRGIRKSLNDCGEGGIYVLVSTPDVLSWLKKIVPSIKVASSSLNPTKAASLLDEIEGLRFLDKL